MRKIIISFLTMFILFTLVACENNVNNLPVTNNETTTSDNKFSGEISFSGFDGNNEYWVIETKDGEEICAFKHDSTKITWTDEVEKKFKGDYVEDIIFYAEELEIEVYKEKELTQAEKDDIDEEIDSFFIAKTIKVTEIDDVDPDEMVVMKPVIYLYPKSKTDVNVKLDYKGELKVTYPEYKNYGWNVTANADGTLVDILTGREYSYLFWEGKDNKKYDMSEGFVVEGKDTAKFLQEKLSYMGLTPKEYNEFIVFWLPMMQENKYNLITFQGKEYTENAKLLINPKPDSVLRVYMTWKALDEKIEIPEQKLSTFDRKGFTVVEWGGSEVTR